MGILKSATVAVTTTGAAGSGAANANSDSFIGEIVGFYVDYAAAAPNTTDVIIKDKRTGKAIWTLNNANTDIYVSPAIGAVDSANASLLSATANGVHARPYCVDQGINVDVAGANSATNEVVVTVFYRK